MRAISFLAFLTLAGAAFAQLSPEEAEKRLHERQALHSAVASTQPAIKVTTNAKLLARVEELHEELAALKAENKRLREAAENSPLRAEVVSLQAEVASLQVEIDLLRRLNRPATRPADVVDKKVAQALLERRPEVGMSLEQWRALDRQDVFPHFYASQSGSEGKIEYYLLSAEGIYGSAYFDVDVVDGKITRWGYKKLNRRGTEQFNPR